MTAVNVYSTLVTVERTRCAWGHQARCDCGWRGEPRLSRTAAVVDGCLHFCTATHERTAS